MKTYLLEMKNIFLPEKRVFDFEVTMTYELSYLAHTAF